MKYRLSGSLWAIGFLMILASSAKAQTWVNSPGTADWNTGTNWDTSTVPNSGSAVATFGTSTVTDLTLSASANVDSVQFNAGASSYTIDNNGSAFVLSGAGVVNNSGGAQTLVSSNNSSLSFTNSASAANAVINVNGTFSNLSFFNSSTAANSTVNNNGYLNVYDSATAGSATITNNAYLYLYGNSQAGSASITNNQLIVLNDSSSLGSAVINSSGNSTTIIFNGDPTGVIPGSTAASAIITNGGIMDFEDNSTAGSAVITVTGSGRVFLNGQSTAGSAQFNLVNNLSGIDISANTSAVTLYSMQGAGYVLMGANNLAIGTGNMSTTFAGVLGDDESGSANLFKLGTGTLTLDGTNTYTGGTNILAGAIVVDSNGQLGTGTVQNNAGLSFINNANAGSLNYQNNLSGTMAFLNNSTAGSATIQNGGVLTFYNTSTAGKAAITNVGGLLVFTDNSSTGSTTITDNGGGTVDLNLSSDASSTRFIVNGAGTFDISGHAGDVTVQSITGAGNVNLGTNDLTMGIDNQNMTLSGVISGTGGSLTKDGSGTLTLSGNNTYTGGTTVLSGVLAVSADDNMGLGGVLSLNNGTLQTLAGFTSTRLVNLFGGGGGIIDTNGFTSTLSGVVSGPGFLDKTGTGTLILSGTNTYTGGTNILGGTLALGNSSALGSGSVSLVNGTMMMSGGTPVVVNWNGDYVQSAGTTLSLGIGGIVSGQWDALNLQGVAHLNGTLNLYAYSGYAPHVGDSVALITANGDLEGQFSQWITPAGVRWVPVYVYGPGGELTITAIQPSFAALALTSNQKSVATMLDGLYGNSQFQGLMLTLGTQAAVPLQADYDLIAPAQLTAVYPVLYAAAQNRAMAIEDRLSGIVGVNAPRLSASQAARWDMESPMYADSNHQAIQDRRVIDDAYAYRDQTAERWGSFLNTTEDLANIGSDTNAAGYKFTVTGMTAGVDYRFSKDLAAGLLLGYDLANTTSSSGGSLDINDGHAGLYGGWGNNGLHVEALAEAGLPTFQTTRLAYEGTATGNATGMEFSGWLNGGYDFKLGTTSLGLFAGGQYTYANLAAFTESGSTLPLAYPSQGQNDLRGDVGVRASRAWHMGSMVLTPNLGISYEHQFDGYADGLTAALAMGGGSFTVQGPAIGQDDVAVGAGINLQFAQGIGAFVQYDGKFLMQNYDRQNFSGGVNIGF